jgi:hypothetical protein
MRRRAVKEDFDMIKSIYQGKYQYKIRTKNDEPIYELRRILKEKFAIEFQDNF